MTFDDDALEEPVTPLGRILLLIGGGISTTSEVIARAGPELIAAFLDFFGFEDFDVDCVGVGGGC